MNKFTGNNDKKTELDSDNSKEYTKSKRVPSFATMT